MERYTIKQRVKVIQTYYENGRSNQNEYRAFRDLLVQFNRLIVGTIGKVVQKFEQTGSVGEMKTPVLLLFAIVWLKSRTPHARRRAKQLHLSRSSLMNSMNTYGNAFNEKGNVQALAAYGAPC